MIKNMVFDMGNVLAEFNVPAYCATFVSDPADQKLVIDELFHSVEWAQMDRGILSVADAARKLEPRLPERLRPHVLYFIEHWYDQFTPIPGMEDLVAGLKANGYALYVLSNASETVEPFKQVLPVFKLFDGLFFSKDYKLLKPDARIYRKFTEVFSLNAEECFFTDDMSLNIEGAINEGFQGFVFRFDAEALKAAMREAGVRI